MPINTRSTLLLSIFAAAAVSASAATTRIVNNNSIPQSKCNAQYTSIQSAVDDSSAGDTVFVCNGIYTEQITVTKGITLAGQSGAEVQPVNFQPNAVDFDDPNLLPIAAALVISGTSGVIVNDLIFDGAANNIQSCAPTLVGILIQNASATIANSSIRYMELSPALFGCQGGLGIYAQTASGMTSNVTVSQTTIHDFQKNGITVNDAGSTATIKSNYVTGSGPTPAIAQNGIQIAFGAAGTVSGNVVGQHVYSPCDSPTNCGAASTDILVYESSGITISNNVLGLSQTAIDIDYLSNNCTVTGNRIENTLVFDGIFFYGDANTATSNVIVNSAESGVDILGMQSRVNNNTILEAPIGILTASGSGTTQTGNKFFAVPLSLQNDAGITSPGRSILQARPVR